MNYKLSKYSLLSLFIMLCTNVFADEVTLRYSGTTTAFMTGENDAALLSLDATAWSVVGDNGNNAILPGLNKAGDLRLYWKDGGGNTVTVTSLTGAIINYIVITFTNDDYANASVTVNGNAVSGVDGLYTINSSSFVLGNANTMNTQVRISNIVINYSVGSPNQTTTTIQLGNIVSQGVIGEELALPSVTVNAGETAVAGAAITWSSSDEKVAAIVDGKLKLKSAGMAKITADYAGNANYMISSANFTVTVYEVYTSIREMMENISATKQYVQFQFKNLLVVGVIGSNTYVNDGTGDFLLYGSNLDMKAGDRVSGKASGQLYLYYNQPELSTSKANVEFTVESNDNAIAPSIISPEELGVNVNKFVTIKNATFVSASGKNLTFKADGQEFIAYNQFKLADDIISALVTDKAYDILGFAGCYKNTQYIYPMMFAEMSANDNNNVLHIYNMEANRQGTIILPIELANEDAITAFQFELVLPDGVTIEDAVLTLRKSNQTLSYSKLGNGNYQLVAFSSDSRAFSGNSGELVNVQLKVGDTVAAGDYTIEVKNIELTTTDEKACNPADCFATLTVSDVQLGDANGDGKISITDAVAVVNKLLGRPSSNFREEAADVNGDGKISITDAVAIVNIVLGKRSANARVGEPQ